MNSDLLSTQNGVLPLLIVIFTCTSFSFPPFFLSFLFSTLIFIISCRYEEKEGEPVVTAEAFRIEALQYGDRPDLAGAGLVSAISKYPNVAKTMREVAAKYD
jgi:hypothetical protein